MIEQLIKELASRPCLDELKTDEWMTYSTLYHELDIFTRPRLIKAIASHSGVPLTQTSNALHNLMPGLVASDVQELIISSLHVAQSSATSKINTMQQRSFFKQIDVSTLSISRAEWIAIIDKFERLEKKKITPLFFFDALRSLRKIPYDELTSSLNKQQLPRQAKRRIEQKDVFVKRAFQSFKEDGGDNPLILEIQDENRDLQLKVETTGARSSEVFPATPDKRYPFVVRTPGGNKARPLCQINGQTLFQPCTPLSKAPKQGRVDVRDTTLKQISFQLPKLPLEKAQLIKFTATLAAISERSGIPRRVGQNSQMKAKASDVFRAHGIEIKPQDGRSHHWAHLIAHFLGDIQDLCFDDSDEEVLNLVPSTAAANYNTLEAIENFIKNKLIDEDTDKIDIEVEPVYNGEALIPDMLNYTLYWTGNYGQKCNEIFYISPQSYERITKSAHETIKALRNWRDSQQEPRMDDAEETKLAF
jgi:hypothetical protein